MMIKIAHKCNYLFKLFDREFQELSNGMQYSPTYSPENILFTINSSKTMSIGKTLIGNTFWPVWWQPRFENTVDFDWFWWLYTLSLLFLHIESIFIQMGLADRMALLLIFVKATPDLQCFILKLFVCEVYYRILSDFA